MSSVDQRVVEMKFNHNAFTKGIADTLSSLTKLQDGLKLQGASQGVMEAQTGMDQLGQKTGMLGGQFTALQAMAFGALASIGAKAIQTGTQVAKSLTIAPVMQGFSEYETNMNSIQTILANTSAAGTGLKEVNAALDEMNLYSDKTIYNFSEMAKNVGTFTAAGVDLDTATGSIKGIANLAAVSGSNSQQAAGAMYQLSQEIAAGKVTLMGWNSVVNAGMGGTIFQRALAETAVAMGKIDDSSLKLEGDMKNVVINGKAFRDSISAEGGGESWLTSDVLTNTLQQFTGDLSEAELAAQGFTKAQIEAIQAQAKTAVGAATEVKTLSGLMDTLKEGVASGWATTFRTVVGDFEEAKKLFTGISNTVGGFLGGISDRRNEMLAQWKYLGGRDALLEGLRAGFEALSRVMSPVIQAFRMIFPRKTAMDLAVMSNNFRDFMQALRPSAETFNNIRRTAQGVFSVFSIVITVVKSAAKAFLTLFDGLDGGGSAGKILAFTANIGDFLTNLNRMLKTGDDLDNFFMKIANVIRVPIEMIKDLVGWISQLIDGMSKTEAVSKFGDIFAPVEEAGSRLQVIGDRIMNVLRDIREGISNFISTAKSWISDNLGDLFSGIDFEWNADTILGALGIGAGAGLGALLIKALGGIKTAIGNFSLLGSGGEGMLESVKNALEGVSGTLQGMQQNLKANALLKLAGAIGIMALSVLVLSGIPADGLIRASVAMAGMMAILAGGMMALDKATSFFGAPKLAVLGFALIGLAAAVLILSFAMKNLAGISWNDIAKGLVTISTFLVLLTAASMLMGGQNQALMKTGASLLLVAVAVKVLVSAMEDLSGIKWENIGKGIAAIVVLLGALGLFSRFAEANKAGLSNGAGILLLAVAIKVLASAVGDFAQYNWEELGQGMAGIAVGLALLAGAMFLIPADGGMSKGAGVLLMAFAMKILAQAVGEFAELSWMDMAKGLIAMNFALGSIATMLERLESDGIIKKAAGLVIVAVGLKIVASALEDMGSLSWNELVKGLVGLTVSLAMIALGVNAMRNAMPGAAAMLVVAAALRILFPVIKGFSEMSWEELVKGLLGLVGVFVILGGAALILAPLAPVLLVIGAALGLIGLAVGLAAAGVLLFAMALTALAASGAAGAAAFGVILRVFIDMIPYAMAAIGAAIIAFAEVIIAGAPTLFAAFSALINGALQVLIDVAPKFGETMLTLLIVMLYIITNAIPLITQAAIDLILGFLGGVSKSMPKIVKAAADLIVNFLDSMASNMDRIITAGANLIIKFLDGLAREVPRVVDAAMQMVIDIVNGIADSVRENNAEMLDAGINLVDAVIDGIVDGVRKLGGKAKDAVMGLAGDMLDGALGFLGIKSPSRTFRDRVGVHIPTGLAAGIDKKGYVATDATRSMGKNMLNEMGKSISGLGNLVGGMDDFNPVIRPVLDLSDVQSGASNLSDILGVAPIDLSNARSSASAASAEHAANLEALAELVGANAGTNISMTQINNSPKALSSAEIYRNTNNQISRAKGALTNAN